MGYLRLIILEALTQVVIFFQIGGLQILSKLMQTTLFTLAAVLIISYTQALNGDLPDPVKTPGAIFSFATAKMVCEPGWAKRHRNVTEEEKRQVYAEYGIAHHKPGDYEVDHLISLEIGGNNQISNLWPQSFITHPWNAHVKDKLENKLHELVCKGELELAVAQKAISTNWIDAYHKYIGDSLLQ
jgi:hypothetical protein